MNDAESKILEKEYISELLKERIYATFALLAVLVSVDTIHAEILHTAYIIVGTILSLWAASIVATIMSRRMVFREQLDHKHEIRHQVRIHAPMLSALILPLILLMLAGINVLSLAWAVDLSIASAFFLLVLWSIFSAKSMNAKKIPTIILIAIQLLIGIGVISLKTVVGH